MLAIITQKQVLFQIRSDQVQLKSYDCSRNWRNFMQVYDEHDYNSTYERPASDESVN